jgi:hypothetical protein
MDIEQDSNEYLDESRSPFRPDLSTITEEIEHNPITEYSDNKNTSSLLKDESTISEENMEPYRMREDPDGNNTSNHAQMENYDLDEEIGREFQPGPLKKFMDLETTLNIFKDPHDVLLDEVPTGRKDGMFYVLDNSINIQKRQSGKRSEFWEDCGAWVGGASPC